VAPWLARTKRSRRVANVLIPGILNVLVVATLVAGPVDAPPLRPITVEDCVRTRRVVDQELQISPDGTRVAYVLKAPDPTTNRNGYQLYVRELRGRATRENGHLVLQADLISGIRWLGPRAIIARVETGPRNSGNFTSTIEIVNALTGRPQRLRYPGTIEQYSASADGNTLVFSVGMPAAAASSAEQQKVREERGYPIHFGEGAKDTVDQLPEDELYAAKGMKTGKLEVRKLDFNEAGGPQHESSLRDVEGLDLSPDGKHLLVTYSSRALPPEWADEPYLEYAESRGRLFYTYVLGLYDMKSARLSSGFPMCDFLLQTSWSQDSRSYSVVSPSPFGTGDARAEAEAAIRSGDMNQFINRLQHVFVVDVETGTATRVLRRENETLSRDAPLVWKHSDGPMLVRASETEFVWMARQEGEWRETDRFDIGKEEDYFSSLASDGQVLVGVRQTTMNPPDLFAVDLESRQRALLTDLNPEYRGIRLGKVERIEWTNRYGSPCAGLLIEPVGYEAGKRYPMIFLSVPPGEMFISDAFYATAYAPQSLANAGFVVVMARHPVDDRIPKDAFPGEMREAYNWMAMVEGAVDLLVDRGMVDRNNLGIGGFSRTSWLTDFTITHSSYRFVAASSADSGIYTYGGYFMSNSHGLMSGFETQLGGPPYGKTFNNWLKYAAPFNAEKTMAAILMEYTRTSQEGFEFFTALNRLGKAVELYRYPKGGHPLDTPFERVASLQRNVDWFRFWMQGYEGKAPDYDPSQYVRWRALRSRREASGEAALPASR
jgi:hypothetical protein